MKADRPICVVIGALGGQGGGVLADWLVEAARRAGYPAQATSIPGVAQRTGATTYYFELFPEKSPAGDPVFCLFPSAGDVDLVAALEPTEAGRTLERGHVTARTTVITAKARIYSTAEKVAAGDGTIPSRPILTALGEAAAAVLALDMAQLAEASGGQANAVLFGAIAGCGVLPLTPEECRAAIEAKGVAVDANLAGFAAGLRAAAGDTEERQTGPVFDSPPPGFDSDLAQLPDGLRPLVGHALARLVDYQDAAYARLYLERLVPFVRRDIDPENRLAATVARRLAAWMSFEDLVRVAQLKTRPGRFARIRGELELGAGAPLRVTDYLKPGRDELVSLLPPALARLVPQSRRPKAGQGWALAIRTSSVFGFALMKLVAALRGLRRSGVRFREEQDAIEGWLTAVSEALGHDHDLACGVADLAIWARGYGAVRADGFAKLKSVLRDWKGRLETDRAAVAAEVEAALTAARANPDTFARPS